MISKFAVGIVTCNRPDFCKKLIDSLPINLLESGKVFIENTGERLVKDERIPIDNIHKFENKTPVVYGKNALFRRILLETEADYIFILEDDIEIIDPLVFEKYIEAHLETGIHHFNFGFSQKENLDEHGRPLYKKIVEYPNNVKLVLTHNILGAFSFYTRSCLEKCGIMDENFNENAFEHVEFTHRIQLKGFAGNFWWFEDIWGSWNMIRNQGEFKDTTIRHNQDYINCIKRALQHFRKIYGYNLLEIPMMDEISTLNKLRTLRLASIDSKNQRP